MKTAAVLERPTARRLIAKQKAPPDIRMQQIYHAAAGVFIQKGFDAATLQDVAAAVGLTKAGLYHHIRGKEQLLFDTMMFAMDRIELEVLKPALATANPAGRIRLIASRYATMIVTDIQDFTLLIEEVRPLSRTHHKTIARRRRAFYDLVRDTVIQLRRSGAIPAIDPSIAALTFFGVIMWTAHWYRPNGRMNGPQVVAQIVDLTTTRLLRMEEA